MYINLNNVILYKRLMSIVSFPILYLCMTIVQFHNLSGLNFNIFFHSKIYHMYTRRFINSATPFLRALGQMPELIQSPLKQIFKWSLGSGLKIVFSFLYKLGTCSFQKNYRVGTEVKALFSHSFKTRLYTCITNKSVWSV